MSEEEEERRVKNRNINNISISTDNLSFAYNLGKEMQQSEYTILELRKQVSNLNNRLDIIENKVVDTKTSNSQLDDDYKSFEGIRDNESPPDVKLKSDTDEETDTDSDVESKEDESKEDSTNDINYDDMNAQPVYKNSREYLVLETVSTHKNCCTHVIAKELGCTTAYASVLVTKLVNKSRIKKTEKTSCSESHKNHDKYELLAPLNYLIKDTTKKKSKKVKASKKKIKQQGWMMKDTKVGRVLKCICKSDIKEGMCSHAVANKLGIDAKDASRSIGYWVSRGRIIALDKEDVCPDSRKMHKFYKPTQEITDDMFLDMKEENAKLEQTKYDQKMAIITQELDIQTYDPSGTYIYKDVMQSINDHKKELDMQYTSFIGKNAIREGFDKNWKLLEKALDRLEQDNLVVHKKAYGLGSSLWKLTQLGYKKLMGYDVEETSDDAQRDKKSENELNI